MKSPLRYISGKLFVLLLAVMVVVFGVHTWINIRTTSSNLSDLVYTSADRASDLIVRSTRYGMLLNRKEDVHETIRTIGIQPGFVEINIYDKTGEIIFSTDSLKIGHTVDLDAEACHMCHAHASPLASIPTENRRRVYESPDQGRVLGLINPIRNEPDCYNAACHAHKPEQTVLGVLDVKMSLAPVEQRVESTKRALIASSVSMTLLIAGISGLFILRLIRHPIRDLMNGMRTLSSGDLTMRIPITSDDEVGRLATSFNTMADELQAARSELQDWAHTLEDRIAKKTTELEEIQAQVLQMEKMASLGKLSTSVAHEINNPLFGVVMYSRLLLRELEGDDVDPAALPTIRRHLTTIQQESSRAGDIVKNLLSFARKTGGQFAEHHLHGIVSQTLAILQHHFQLQRVDVRTELTTGDDTLFCDEKQIQQALIALCINSVEAMPEGGVLTVATEARPDAMLIRITDTGVGIPPNALPRIFEPFFTTKDGESGLGLGLAIVYGIVQRHQGKMGVESKEGKGTSMKMTLPRRPVAPPPDSDDETLAPPHETDSRAPGPAEGKNG